VPAEQSNFNFLVDGNRLRQEPARRGISLCFLHGFRNLSEVRQVSRQDTFDVKCVDG
jgi:hypothetical protein